MINKEQARRFRALKTQVGGNRERYFYEDTFGPTQEEQASITKPNKTVTRILSELNFAMQLSARRDNEFDGLIDQALSVLEQSMKEEGALPYSVCRKAEEILLPIAPAAKEYNILYVAHAHTDLNWTWGWQETVAIVLSTFRTMLQMMREYPEFTFMQSQGAVYRIVERYAPEMMEEIKQRIAEGRWEVTASAWVETDKNMPDTESLLHHISVTRKYLKDVWGIDPDSVKVDFSPDTFGHSRFVPEINLFGNVKYYYHCRGMKDKKLLYRYRAPSGAEILSYREPYWYNGGVNPDDGIGAVQLSEMNAGLKTMLLVYGVGDHGGGPTRRDIERILEMKEWPVFPAMRFGSLHEYFAIAESVRNKVDVIEHELNPILTGCYTTQSRLKLGNRKCEVALNDAEKVCALGHLVAGCSYPEKNFDSAWQNTLFTHFHDILTGSCVQESREYAMGLFAETLAYTQTAHSDALRIISEQIDTSKFITDEDITDTQSEGAGVGYGLRNYAGVPNCERGAGKTRVYTVYNTSSFPRNDNVEFYAWDYMGDLGRVEVVDKDGAPIPHCVIETGRHADHRFVKFAAKVRVPAMGYTVICLREKEIDEYKTYWNRSDRVQPSKGPVVLENRYLKATFDTLTGTLVSLIDKETGKEQLSAPVNVCLVDTEKRTSNAWQIGRYLRMEPLTNTVSFAAVGGGIHPGVRMEQKIMASTVRTWVYLDDEARELKYELEIDWNEAENQNKTNPVLIFRVPCAAKPAVMTGDVPAGLLSREGTFDDAAYSTFASVPSGDRILALASDCKYGYRLINGDLICTLLNTVGNPDPYPERGIHRVTLWLSVADDILEMKRRTERYNRPMIGVPTAAKPGKLPMEQSLLTFDGKTTVLTGVSLAEDGALCVRVNELSGKEDTVSVGLPFPVASASLTDMDGNPADGVLSVNGNAVSFPVGPYRLAEVRIKAK